MTSATSTAQTTRSARFFVRCRSSPPCVTRSESEEFEAAKPALLSSPCTSANPSTPQPSRYSEAESVTASTV